VVLVGHSWAGSVITQAGNDDKVKALVYVKRDFMMTYLRTEFSFRCEHHCS
jgi:hypothetical protein